MSNTADVLHNIAELILALSELLETDTIQALVQMARDFGIGQPVKTGLELLSKALALVLKWIQSLEQVAALPAFLETLDPAFDALKALTDNSSGDELREAGFEALAPVADSARTVLGLMDKLRQGAQLVLEGILPAGALAELRASVERLATTLRTMQQQLDTPPRANALAAGGKA
jgi:hypothetical protein